MPFSRGPYTIPISIQGDILEVGGEPTRGFVGSRLGEIYI